MLISANSVDFSGEVALLLERGFIADTTQKLAYTLQKASTCSEKTTRQWVVSLLIKKRLESGFTFETILNLLPLVDLQHSYKY